MALSIRLRRLGYRVAYLLLMVNWYTRHPQTRGVKCLLNDGDRVLLVRHSYGPVRWDVPGGGMHRAEPPQETARREMAEELGLELNWQPLGSVRAIVDQRRDTLYCFTAVSPGAGLAVDPVEIAAAEWFARTELPTPRAAHVDAIVRLSEFAT